MSRYYYDYYEIAVTNTYTNRRALVDTESGRILGTATVHTDYSYGDNGFYGVGGIAFIDVYEQPAVTIYIITDITVYKVTSYIQDGNYFNLTLTGVEICDKSTSYAKGAYIGRLEAEDGEYPDDGMFEGFWYVKVRLVFPSLKLRVGGELKTSEMGWVRVGGALKEIESITVRVGGALKEAT